MILAVTAVLASTTLMMQPEPAEAGLLRRALLRGHHHHGLLKHRHRHLFRHHRHRRFFVAPVIATPVIAAPVLVAPPIRASAGRLQRAAPASPQNADGAGRVFDPASMAWTDGRNQCWSGRQPWSFRNGSWFYGNSRWYPANGTWLTDAPEPPIAIDCQFVAAFAPSKPTTTSTSAARNDKPSRDDTGENSGTGCTKYSAGIGRTIAVPCEG
jgi:hypothetical protein